MKTRTGELLTSMNSFAVMKCSAWLVSNESFRLKAPSLVKQKYATISYRTLLTSFPYRQHRKKHYGLRKASVPKIMGRHHYHAGMSAYGHVSRECNGWPVSRHELLDATTHFTGAWVVPRTGLDTLRTAKSSFWWEWNQTFSVIYLLA